MENSSTPNFSSLLNSTMSSSDSQNQENNQQNQCFPPSFPMPYPPYQFGPNFQPQFPVNFNPFGVQAGYQQFHPSSYHGVPFPGNFGAFQSAGAVGPSSPVGSAILFGGAGGSGSRGDEYSPNSSPPVPASSRRRRRYIGRDRQDAENRLQHFYFSENPMYTDAQFRRRYKMKKHLFLLKHVVVAIGSIVQVLTPYNSKQQGQRHRAPDRASQDAQPEAPHAGRCFLTSSSSDRARHRRHPRNLRRFFRSRTGKELRRFFKSHTRKSSRYRYCLRKQDGESLICSYSTPPTRSSRIPF